MNARPRGIPLRADPSALHEREMRTFVRSLIAIANGKLDPQRPTRDFLVKRFGSDAASEVETVMRAASSPAMTSATGWAKELATTTVAFLAALAPLSAGAGLLRRCLSLEFNGAAAINIPSVSTPLFDFIAEGAGIPVVNGTAGIQVALQPAKFAGIVVLTRELIEAGSAEQLIQDALVQSAAPSLDRRLFDSNAAVAGLRPAGLLHNISALTPSTNPGGKDDTMRDDLQALLGAVAAVAGNSPVVVVAAPAQAIAINLRSFNSFSYAVLASAQLAPGTVIAIAVNSIVSAVGDGPQIDVTRTASVMMNDAPSSDLLSDGRVVATFQTDSIALRLKWPLTWAPRDLRGISWMQSVLW